MYRVRETKEKSGQPLAYVLHVFFRSYKLEICCLVLFFFLSTLYHVQLEKQEQIEVSRICMFYSHAAQGAALRALAFGQALSVRHLRRKFNTKKQLESLQAVFAAI